MMIFHRYTARYAKRTSAGYYSELPRNVTKSISCRCVFSSCLTFVTMLEIRSLSSCSQLLRGVNKETFKAKQPGLDKVIIFTTPI